MPIYQSLVQNNFVVPLGTPANAAANTVGGMLMAQFAQRHQTWPANAPQILDTFHNHMQMFWTWDPSQVAGNGAALLDGMHMRGYCGQLASAFKALLCAPAPYGFGVKDADTAEHVPAADLFLANHPGPVFDLKPNVLAHDWATSARAFLPLYAWGNHIVVRQGGRFYDPCYNRIYPSLTSMERYAVRYNAQMVGNSLQMPTATTVGGPTYTFQNVQQGSQERSRHPLSALVAPAGLPA